MSIEKYIKGKIDSAHHAGRICNEKRKQASEARINEYYASEHDPEGIDMASYDPYSEETIIFDPYPESLLRQAKKGGEE